MTEFKMLVFKLAPGAFKSKVVDLLINHSRLSAAVGQNGCKRIVRDPDGGFDLYGELDNEHMWICSSNVIWGRKLEIPSHPEPATADTVKRTVSPGIELSRADEKLIFEKLQEAQQVETAKAVEEVTRILETSTKSVEELQEVKSDKMAVLEREAVSPVLKAATSNESGNLPKKRGRPKKNAS